ncbi:MAG TPA: hypothetical protein VH062_04790 [Polyangiaceae bacterium]|jgi:hypothetical protein|nr:hypothetical protein [Polyangiaceae bacterium]
MAAPDLAGRTLRRALPYAPAGAVAAALGYLTVRTVLERVGGPGAPLDDTYIHFQYARSIAELHPFRYTPGAAPTPGATSLLWPLLLAPFYAVGFRGEALLWPAWLMGFGALALLAVETKRVADGLVDTKLAVAAGAMVLAFSGYSWFAGSGMEVLPFAYLLARSARQAASWMETTEPDTTDVARRRYRELVALAVLTPLMRPEGAIASLFIAAALAYRPYAADRRYALPALLGPLAPSLVSFVFTGQAMASTAVAKWLPLNPYYGGAKLIATVTSNVALFFGTLLDGRLWTSLFLPNGGHLVAILALVAIPVMGVRADRRPRAFVVLAVAVAMLVPASYETFLVNRVRYIWPFAWAWFVGLAALCELAGGTVERGLGRLGMTASGVSLLLGGTAVGVLASLLRPSIDDLSTSAEAVTLQQVSLGRWAKAALPADARVGVNDTGAMAYFSDHTTFDVVGLTTRGEARYWTAGPGARFEHYERLPRERLPTHFVVYPEWFGVDVLLGEELTSRSVSHTILGGYTMAAYRATYELLGSGQRPTDSQPRASAPLDTLDVADIDDESTHAYALFDATRETCVVLASPRHADGARLHRRRDEFRMVLAPGGTLVARWDTEREAHLRVSVDDRTVAEPFLLAGHWQEVAIDVPADVSAGPHAVRVDALSDEFASLHYWSYR